MKRINRFRLFAYFIFFSSALHVINNTLSYNKLLILILNNDFLFTVDYPTTTPYSTSPSLTPPKIFVSIQEKKFQIVHIGNTVRYHCTGRSLDNVRFVIIKT